jgi:hypothetical protein
MTFIVSASSDYWHFEVVHRCALAAATGSSSLSRPRSYLVSKEY